jgi:hypothetical protein
VSLLLLEGSLLVVVEVGSAVTSSWKIVKRPKILLRGACEVVSELAISRVDEKITIRRDHNSMGSEKDVNFHIVRRPFMVTCISPTVISLHTSK